MLLKTKHPIDEHLPLQDRSSVPPPPVPGRLGQASSPAAGESISPSQSSEHSKADFQGTEASSDLTHPHPPSTRLPTCRRLRQVPSDPGFILDAPVALPGPAIIAADGSCFLGCWADSLASRALPRGLRRSRNQTVEACHAIAIAKEVALFGLQYSTE